MRGCVSHEPSNLARPRAAYTLVELLVVLSILAVLAGLILTGALAIRRRADVAHCASNLTQLGVAIRLYMTDCGTVPLIYYQNAGTSPPPKRPPSPPPDHDIEMVLGDYVANGDTFRCPIRSRLFPGWDLKYPFNETASGLRPSQIRAGESRALIVYDAPDVREVAPHGGKLNACFLDGHVKAYPWIQVMTPYLRDPSWPPD